MIKLQNNFTTIKQSKRLLELGVPACTADCYYQLNLSGYLSEDTPIIISFNLDIKGIVWDEVYAIPCWSVGRLVEIAKICSQSRYALRGLFLFLEECEADECMSQVMDYFETCNHQFTFQNWRNEYENR